MVLECRKIIKNVIAVIVIALLISCCTYNYSQYDVQAPNDIESGTTASIYASFAPIEEIRIGQTEEKPEIVSDNSHVVSTRQSFSKTTLLLYKLPMSLSLASVCVAILYAVTKAASGNLYIIDFIHLSDGMK